ncbi:MAG TPA: hypothetical protein VMN57_17230 [Anaerolineales bacterium]|nr:hypothetical protein [Anaerolineales bacterium]
MKSEAVVHRQSYLDPTRFLGSVLTGVICGAAAGLVAGVLARGAMRVVAVLAGQTPGFSIGGSLFIILFGALLGTAPGLLYAFTLPVWPASAGRKGLVIGVALALLFAVPVLLVEPEGELALIPRWTTALLFAPIGLVYGLVLGRVAGRLAPASAAEAIVPGVFLRQAGLLVLASGLVSGLIEIFLAAAFPAASLTGTAVARFLEGLAGGTTLLAMIAGLAGLLRSGAAGKNRFVTAGLAITLTLVTVLGIMAAFGGFSMIEVHGLVRVMSRLEFDPNLLMLLVLLAAGAVFMLAAGIAVLRAGVWRGWRRFSPLAVGLVPLLSVLLLHPALLPALLDISILGRNQLGHWVGAAFALAWLALGLAMRAESDRIELDA